MVDVLEKILCLDCGIDSSLFDCELDDGKDAALCRLCIRTREKEELDKMVSTMGMG